MNDQPCDRCPCPGVCLRWSAFCAWAAKDPPEPHELAHICARSAAGPPVAPPPGPDAPTVTEAVELARRMNACPARTKLPGCCTAATCGLRGDAVVTYIDCFACLNANLAPPG